ncbi:DUF5004 domain-containing protein [Dysgonomonas sp. Marseille-P4677]|nr:DUF5004 domain-containing protein [Dysgonomonas sp. Marseille-P4677]
MLLILLASMVSSCDEFKDSNDYSAEEIDKNLSGSWSISQVTRNGSDITNAMDFKAFSITFNTDKTYKIENYLPFLVKENGTWNIDDPQYPSQLIFKENGAPTANISSFEYIINKGERQIILSFAPGCHSNVYTYVLERVAN